ncbi:MAG TPA: aminotransferase class V-fold PLP-dependent enzyme [Spirochaetia bacterium]|nr:aminotransferase class V-fold PLP-dependent enzyme [Spirochaetia bacterium]
MPGLLPDVDPDGLLEYSVVYTDRSVNHMSKLFQGALRDISRVMKEVYKARSAVIVPGSGTFGMEAVARQFATGKKCLVIRNGLFSFRWSQIFEVGKIPSSETVLKARRTAEAPESPFAPVPIAEAVETIRREKPDLVFAPHVETSSGMILPDGFIKSLADAVHAHGGMLVLDCVASGAIWVDMKALGIDILVTAPQKGWSGQPCCGMVALGETARQRIDSTVSTSFSCDLKKWLEIMETYEAGKHAYHATPPTDSLLVLRDVMKEMEAFGFEKARTAQAELGRRVRTLLASRGFKSVAAPGFEAPGVVVSYTTDPDIQSGKKFLDLGMQVAAGVPIKCDEPADYKSFRVGLFGLDKLGNLERTVKTFEATLDKVLGR